MTSKVVRFLFCFILGVVLWLVSPVYLTASPGKISRETSPRGIAQVIAKSAEATTTDNTDSDNPTGEANGIRSAPVMLNGDVLFEMQTELGGISTQTRARDTSRKIRQIAEDNAITLDNIKVVKIESFRGIIVDDLLITVVTPADAKITGLTTDELIEERIQAIKSAIKEYRAIRSPEQVLTGLVRAVIATAFFLLFLYLLNRLMPTFFNRFEDWQRQRLETFEERGMGIISRQKVTQSLKLIYRITRVSANLTLLYIYIPLLLGCFPLTQPISRRILNYFWSAVGLIWEGFIDYLPNLFIIALIIVIAFYSIRLSRFIFDEVSRQRLAIKGFYPEWANPTHNIVVFLIIGLAVVLIYPYLPAANSTGFQGVSVFIGALVTFGSTAIIGNIVSGIVLIYTRSFQVGDVIRVNQNLGRVLEKTMLSTRIITPDNEIITLPNASLFGTEITNFTASIRDERKPLGSDLKVVVSCKAYRIKLK